MNNLLSDTLGNYEIVKLEPHIVIMKHRITRKLYRYVEKNIPQSLQSQIVLNDKILMPIEVESGYLYDVASMSMQNQVQSIYKSGERYIFEQCEIINTIEPIVFILRGLKEKNQSHGRIIPENIVIDQMGSIRVYWPGVKNNRNKYYFSQEGSIEDDFCALSIIILELIGFEAQKQQDHIKILKAIAKSEKYSQKFIFSILCLIQKNHSFMEEVYELFLGGQVKLPLSLQAKQYLERNLFEKNSKVDLKRPVVEFTPPLIKHSEYTPKKQIYITKKYVKGQDVENKKYFEQGKKKKPNQPLKKVSNGKNQAIENSNTNIGSPNYKKILRDIRETKQRQDSFKIGLITKRLRTVSKKKIG